MDDPTETTASGHGLLVRLRALTPTRALTTSEANRVAERQTELLLDELGIAAPAVPRSVIAGLPFITVAERRGFPTSGMVTKTDLGWVVVIRGDESQVRQRFSLAHELKHVLDDPFIDWLYPGQGHLTGSERAERICDYFAACLLMPKRWLIGDWRGGRRDISRLAGRYNVSRRAMEVRLSQLGLLAPTPRCMGTEQEALA